jgi:carboxypeptidase C (cathepsin A)
MGGFFFENGPMRIQSDYGMHHNNWSWDGLMDYFWVDQPVYVLVSSSRPKHLAAPSGTGYSTAGAKGFGRLFRRIWHS